MSDYPCVGTGNKFITDTDESLRSQSQLISVALMNRGFRTL